MKRVIEEDITTYLDEDSKKQFELFYDEGKITHIRFHFDDEDESIKNKSLSLSTKHFKGGYSFSYEKHFDLGNKKRIEYYDDDRLWMYTTIERANDYKIKREYHSDNSLMYRAKTYYNVKGIPIKEEVWNYLEDEKGEYFETIIPIFPGYDDVSKMTENDKKDLSKIINTYQYLDDDKKESFLKKFKPHYNYGIDFNLLDI